MPNPPIDPHAQGPGLSRRELVRHMGQAAMALPALSLLNGCASAAAPASSSGSWLSGGTRSISPAVRALRPLAASSATSCRLTCAATIGPCHTTSVERTDISDGWDGLPMHLQLRVQDAACAPVAGVIVEIWHTNYTGGYSGQIHPMCNNDAQDSDKQFFRGWQRTDSQGLVSFDSCFPGWYSSRANHIHLRLMPGDYDPADSATASVITQLLFPDALNNAIFQQQPLYLAKGLPDTSLDTDNVLGAEADKSPYLFDVQNVNGVMLASKTLTIRRDLAEQLCMVQGRMPPGGRRGPPPGSPLPGGMPPPQGWGPRAPGLRPPKAS